MSLGLPEFGSRGQADDASSLWRGVRIAGFVALSYALAIAISEGLAANAADRSMAKASAEAAAMAQSAESARRSLLKSADLQIAASSVESSPEHVFADLRELLPEGVSPTTYKIEYQPDGLARVDLGIVARSPEAYDRFLSALSKSKRFRDIRPGSEIRPGLVRATVTALHRPEEPGR